MDSLYVNESRVSHLITPVFFVKVVQSPPFMIPMLLCLIKMVAHFKMNVMGGALFCFWFCLGFLFWFSAFFDLFLVSVLFCFFGLWEWLMMVSDEAILCLLAGLFCGGQNSNICSIDSGLFLW